MKMPIKTIFLLILFSIQSSLATGQEESKYFSVGVVPTSLIDPITPSIGLSVEHSIIYRLNAEITYGFDPNINLWSGHPDPSSIHHEYRMGLKYSWTDADLPQFIGYLSVDYFGNQNEYTKQNDSYKEDNVYYDFDDATVTRTVKGIRIGAGIKCQVSDYLWIDLFGGAGLRDVNLRYKAVDRVVSPIPPFDEWITPFDRNAGKKRKPALLVGFKLAYRIY